MIKERSRMQLDLQTVHLSLTPEVMQQMVTYLNPLPDYKDSCDGLTFVHLNHGTQTKRLYVSRIDHVKNQIGLRIPTTPALARLRFIGKMRKYNTQITGVEALQFH